MFWQFSNDDITLDSLQNKTTKTQVLSLKNHKSLCKFTCEKKPNIMLVLLEKQCITENHYGNQWEQFGTSRPVVPTNIYFVVPNCDFIKI